MLEESADPELELTSAPETIPGTSLSWSYDDAYTLTISGSGAIPDYTYSDPAPWSSLSSLLTSVEIGSGITRIGDQAFAGCTKITSADIADTVTSVGEAAFYNCRSLKGISLPAGVTTISSGIFAGCTSLSEFSAPGMTAVEDYAFQQTALSQFTVGAALTSIDPLAFFNTSIQSFQVEPGNPVYVALDGILFTDGGATLFAYPAGAAATSYTVPAGVTKIGESAFSYNKNLEQISLGSVTSLGSSAFQACLSLKSIVIPDSVTEAGSFTFYDCPVLASVKFGTGLQSTSYQMFEKCTGLTSIDFGAGLQSIYARTFANCTSLASVSLPSGITQIGNGAFGNCRALVSFSSAALTEIPYQAFLNDTALVSVSLNEGVQTINRYAFGGCTALAAITLPSTVTFVHSNAFEPTTVITVMNSGLVSYGKNGYRAVEPVVVSGTRNYGYAYQVLSLVNQRRAENGAAPLVMNASLLESAMVRAAEISALFSHTRPDGSSCFDLNSLMSGENIAYGQATPDAVMNSWMNSEGHRANILDGGFTTIGIGCFVIDGAYYWVQCFGTGSDGTSCASPADQTVTQTINIAAGTFSEADTTSGIIWGGLDSYTYTFDVAFEKDDIEIGETTQSALYLINPGSKSRTKIGNTDLVWSSKNPSVADVKNGTVTGVSGGTAEITATTAKGHYTASAEISVKNTSRFTVKTKEKVVYNGKERKPAVTVSFNGKTVSSKYYTVTYSANKNVGIATVTVKGTGSYKKYSGETTFRIVPKKAVLVSAKSNKKKQITVKWQKDTQGKGYEIQYSTGKKFKKSSTVTVGKAKTVKTTLKKLKSGKTYYVRVRTFKKVNGEKLYGAWSKAAKVKVK